MAVGEEHPQGETIEEQTGQPSGGAWTVFERDPVCQLCPARDRFKEVFVFPLG